MQIDRIITRRSYNRRASYDLVYEWEDVFSKYLPAKLLCVNKYLGNHYASSYVPFLVRDILGKAPSLVFDMCPIGFNGENSKNIVPLIIDFFLSKEELPLFYKEHNRQPLVLISSKEVYQFLVDHDCPLNIYHLPLSLPDKWAINKEVNFIKKYDLALMGRQNTIMVEWLKRYSEETPDLYYVFRQDRGEGFKFYTNKGECLGNISSRDQYMSLLRQSKVGLYTVPGILGDTKETHGFHQITPRFLELVASGCHIIASYIDNPDTEYYQIRNFCPSIFTYEEFKDKMDYYRENSVDIPKYSDYLANHYTSIRVGQLKEILNKI